MGKKEYKMPFVIVAVVIRETLFSKKSVFFYFLHVLSNKFYLRQTRQGKPDQAPNIKCEEIYQDQLN